MNNTEPDYTYFIRLKYWSKKDAALIISGLDPSHYQQQKFYPKDIPPELSEVFKLYTLFKTNINYGYQEPRDFLRECHRIAWPVPEKLIDAAINLFGNKTLQETKEPEIQLQDSQDNAREKQNLLKLVGVLIKLYVEKSKAPRFLRSNGKINTASVIDDILQYVSDHCPEISGLGKSTLYDKIKEAISTVEQECDKIPA